MLAFVIPPIMKRKIDSILTVDWKNYSDSETADGTTRSVKLGYKKFLTTGFILACSNGVVNASIWSMLEPLMEQHFVDTLGLSTIGMGLMFFWPAIYYGSK